jgi:hypothetical protein
MFTVKAGTLSQSGVDEFGVDWLVSKVDGWGATASRRGSEAKPRQSGSWSGQPYAEGRTVGVFGRLTAPTPAAASDALDRLADAATIEDFVLRVADGGQELWVPAYRTDAILEEWLNDREVDWSYQVGSDDWRKFGDDVMDTTALPSTFGGLIIGGGADGETATSFTPEQFSSMANRQGYTTNTVGSNGTMELYNADGSRSDATSLAVVADSTDALRIPFTIDAVTVTGQVSLINPGNETGPVRLRIDGPCRGPVVTHVATGAQLIFSSSLVLGYGEWIDVDMEARTVLANGQATRAPWITSRGWSGFTPGENTWSFTAAAFDAAALLTVVATPAWK